MTHHRDLCERISGGPCDEKATLAVKCTADYTHSTGCERKGRCLWHPVCERHGAELRAAGVVARISSYPRLVTAS